jgi:hypothetical protein
MTADRAKAAAEREARRLERAQALAVADAQARDRRRTAIHCVVEETIETEIEGEAAVDSLIADLYERLDEVEGDADFGERPIGEIVARICRDLGVTPDWRRWAGEAWAVEEARARPAGSPYAGSPVVPSPIVIPPAVAAPSLIPQAIGPPRTPSPAGGEGRCPARAGRSFRRTRS